MVRDPFFDEILGATCSESREESHVAPVAVSAEIDAWFADASRGSDVAAWAADAGSSRAPIGTAALSSQRDLVQQRGGRRLAMRSGPATRGRRRARCSEQGPRSRVRPLVLLGIAIASLLAAAIVILPARSSAPDEAARPRIAHSSGAAYLSGLRVERQRPARAAQRRASRTLAHRRTVARERRAATRRADRRSAVRRQRAARVHTPSNAPTLTVTNPHTERPHSRIFPVQPEKRKPPAATGEFEP